MFDWQNKTDQELVILALSRADNFVYLMKRYEPKISAYIKKISNFSKEEIEDLLQEIFIKVYRNLNNYDSKLKFSSWIYRIAHNEVISRFRKIKSRPALISCDIDDNLINKIASNLNIERDLDHKLMKEKLYTCINQLEKKYQVILILKFFEEKDYEEIADILKKPAGTIATLINRGKKQLHKIWQKNNYER